MIYHTFPSKWLIFLFAILLAHGQVMPKSLFAQEVSPGSNIVSTNQDRIVGGQDATPGEWPWQARLLINDSFACGGSLIHPRWVLTAAHCVGNSVISYFPPTAFQVVLGDHDQSTSEASEQIRDVVQVVVHPEWDNATTDNDIALLKLDLPVTLNSQVSTVPLGTSPADDLLMQPGDLATVTGWGDTIQGGNSSAILQEVQVPIVSNVTCDAAMTASITDNMLCAGFVEGGKDSCQGDGGGPLVVPNGSGGWKLAGVVSFGTGCARPDVYGVYARVSRYTDWIESYINSPTGPNPIRNADFELGQNGDWLVTSTNLATLIEDAGLPVTPRSSPFVAWLGRFNSETSIIDQIVTLNERTTSLHFYYQIRSGDALCSVDFGYVEVNDVPVLPNNPLCVGNVTSDWSQATADLSSYAGRTIRLTFAATTDTAFPSSLLIDDVSVATSSLPPFNIANFTPSSGKPGATVTLNGSNFLDLTEVLFNGATASFSVQSDSVLNVTVPAQASTGIITLKTAYSTTTSAQTFTVLQPLTVAKTGNGSGTVTTNPAGVSCGNDCSEDYSDSTEVTLTAAPAANSTFTGWSGACSGSATDCIVDMNAARAVTATFTLKSFAATVNKVGNGTITSSPGGINCGVDCTESYTADTIVTLTAQPDADSLFLNWNEACSGNATNCVLSINEAKSATATFSLKTFTLSISSIGNGSVTSSPAGISCGIDCLELYTIDTDVMLTATPEDDFVFVGWSGACTGNNPDCTVNMDSAKAVTATFAPQTFILSVTKAGNGNVSSVPSGITCGVDCEEEYEIATDVALTAQPEDDSVFVGWGGACSGTNMTCNVTVDSAKNVTANFERKRFALNVTKGGDGKGRVTSAPSGITCGEDCSEDYAIATFVTLTAQPEEGSSFLMWIGACTGAQVMCSVSMNDATSITAVFELDSSSLHLPLIAP